MRILVVTNVRDGKGLARDGEILSRLLHGWGHDVEVLDFRKPPTDPRYGLTIHFEHIEPHLLGLSPADWYIPNPEWHEDDAARALDAGKFARVLCKTKEAARQFEKLTDRVVFVGFESLDRLDPSVPRERVFLHAPGWSAVKGTEAICSAWARANGQNGGPLQYPLDYQARRTEEQIRRAQNRALFHLCPSEYEGFGHVIHEALSVGAIVVTTDAPPMNEVKGAAYFVRPVQWKPRCLGMMSKVDAAGVRAAADWCWALSEKEVEAKSQHARECYEAERAEFRANLRPLIDQAAREAVEVPHEAAV